MKSSAEPRAEVKVKPRRRDARVSLLPLVINEDDLPRLVTAELSSLPVWREISRFLKQIMQISRSPDLECKSPDLLQETLAYRCRSLPKSARKRAFPRYAIVVYFVHTMSDKPQKQIKGFGRKLLSRRRHLSVARAAIGRQSGILPPGSTTSDADVMPK